MARADRVKHPVDPLEVPEEMHRDMVPHERNDALTVPVTRFAPTALSRRWLDAEGVDYVTSMPVETYADKLALANVLNVGGDMLKSQANLVLAVRHVTVVPVDYTRDEDGEVKEGVRVILSTGDGKHYSCGGDAPVRAVRRLIAVLGPLPFDPPVKVRVKPIPLADGKSTYTLEVVS
jgi:hypothetical protein